MWDVAVVGAGPAGCAAAIELSNAGARVGLLDKSRFPRDKLCGEFLSPEVVHSLEALGCADEFWKQSPARIERAVVVSPTGARVEFPFPAPAWGLSRSRFDQIVADAAVHAGARFVQKTEIAHVSNGPGLQILEARDGRFFRSRAVLLAAGRQSLLHPLPLGPRVYFGQKAHYEGECGGRVELYFFRGGYCGISPVENGRVNVCALVEKDLMRAHGDGLFCGIPPLAARLSGMRRLEPFLYTGPVAMGWRRPPAGMLAAGDAALFLDPFTGDGVSLGMASGRMAASHLLLALKENRAVIDHAAYTARLRKVFSHQLRASSLLRLAAKLPWLEQPLLALFRSQAVQRAAFRATRVCKF